MVHTHHGGLKADRGVQDLDQNSCPCIDDRIDWNNEKFHKTEPNFNSQPFCVCVHYKTRLTSDQKYWKYLQISDRQTTSTILKYNCRLGIKADRTWTPNMKLKHGVCPFEFMETGLWASHWLLCTQYIFSFWNCCDYQHNWFFASSLYTRLRSVHIWFDRYSGCVNVNIARIANAVQVTIWL